MQAGREGGWSRKVTCIRAPWVPWVSGRCARFYCDAVEGVAEEKNAVSLLVRGVRWPSCLLSAFLMPLLVAFVLTCVAPGLRPAPDRRPPEQPFAHHDQ